MSVGAITANPFSEGEKAWERGEPFEANPYAPDTTGHRQWCWGWNKARDCWTQDH